MVEQIKTHYSSEELSILELVQIFWQQKWLILMITLFCSGLSLSYILLSKPPKPIYEAKVTIIAPTEGDISLLNIAPPIGGDISQSNIDPFKKMFSVYDIYYIFINVLESESLKQQFSKTFTSLYSIKGRVKLTSPEITIKKDLTQFDKQIITINKYIFSRNKYTISVNTDNPAKSRELIKQFVALATKRAEDELKQLIFNQNLALAKKIIFFKKVIELNKMDAMEDLKKALIVVKGSAMNNASITLTNTSTNLHMLESSYDFYSQIDVSNPAIKMFRLDGVIDTIELLPKSRKELILILGLLTGLIFGTATALLRHSLTRKTQ